MVCKYCNKIITDDVLLEIESHYYHINCYLNQTVDDFVQIGAIAKDITQLTHDNNAAASSEAYRILNIVERYNFS